MTTPVQETQGTQATQRAGSTRQRRPVGSSPAARPRVKARGDSAGGAAARGAGAPATSRPSQANRADAAPDKAATRGWKIATAFLAALLAGTAGWAGYQTTQLRNQGGGQAQAGDTTLEQKIAALDTTTSQLSSDVATIKAQLGLTTGGVTASPGAVVSPTPGATVSPGVTPAPAITNTGAEAFKKVTDTLPVTAEQYTAALAQTKSLNTTYQAAAAAAKAAPTDKNLQIKSLNAQSALLRNCATVFTGATQVLFAAATPQAVMEQTATELASIAGECKVINEQ